MKNLVSKWLSYLFAGFVGAIICFTGLILPATSGPYFRLRDNSNGGFWFSFGPGVISSCNCLNIDVSLGDRLKHVYVTDPQKIEDIKKWILDNKLDNQFNLSPVWPQNIAGRSIGPAYYLWLYDAKEIDASNQFKNSIVFIPLEPLSMKVDDDQWKVKIAELKTIIGTN